MTRRPKIANAAGDPAVIGPEISLKAAVDPQVRAACEPIVMCDPAVLVRHAKACGLTTDGVALAACLEPDAAAVPFGATSAASGRASIAFCRAAIKAALA